MLSGDLPQPTSKPFVYRPQWGRGFALSGAVLASNAARPSLGNPETLLQPTNRAASAFRGQKFPV